MTGFVSSDPLNNLTNVYQRPPCITANRAPTTNDVQPAMTFWEDQSVTPHLIYQTTGAGSWALANSSTSALNTLSDTSSTLVTPSSNNIQLNGTTNQISVTAGSGELTFSLPSAITAPGTLTVTGATTLAALTQTGTSNINTSGSAVTSIGTGGTGAVNIGNATGNTAVTGSLTASTALTATSGAITATNGNLVFGTAGNRIRSTSVATTTTAGANSFGSVTLVGGTATISTSSVSTTSLIYLSRLSVGSTGSAALGELSVGAIVNATNFTINAWQIANASALQTTDVSVVAWMIVN